MAQYILDVTTTWNSGATVFHGIKLNVTDTASASTSRLFTFQIGAVDKIHALKTGALVSASTLTATGLAINSGGTIDFASSNVVLTHSTGILTVSTGELRVTNPGEDDDSVVTVSSLAGLSIGGAPAAGAIGSYMFATADYTGNVAYAPGDTLSGSSLNVFGINRANGVGTTSYAMSGTWQSMGKNASNGNDALHYGSLWVRTA